MMLLTPLTVARSQLLTAIELFFADKDPVAVQALAGNAREMLEQLCRLARVEPMTELLLQDHPGRPKKDIYAAMNLYRNCFKHLGDTEKQRQEDQITLNQFNDAKNDYLLYICAEDYGRLRRAMPIPVQIFHSWFCAGHVDLLTDQSRAKSFLDRFPGIQDMTRAQQKRAVAACIERFSDDAEWLADEGTEPLVIDR
jgi:hypothetical protein